MTSFCMKASRGNYGLFFPGPLGLGDFVGGAVEKSGESDFLCFCSRVVFDVKRTPAGGGGDLC